MKKITSLFALLLLSLVAAQATTTWESRSGWTQASGGNANINWFGAATPGTTSTVYTMSEFQIMQTSGLNETRYIAIATAYSASSLSESNVVAVSNNAVQPSSLGLCTYTFDSDVMLTGGTTYYVVFLTSNTPSSGAYTVGQGRIALNHTDYGTYAPGCSNDATSSTWWPYFTAKLTEVESINVTYVFMDNDTEVRRMVVTQGANSAVVLPTGLTSGYSNTGYDFPTSGTIGTTDCTITVTATPKEGVVTATSQLSNDKAYRLITERGTLGSNGTQMVSTNGTSYEASDFAIISYEENYYLWSVADSKWVKNQTQPDLTDNVGEAGTLSFDPSGLDKPLFFMGMGTNGVNVAGGYGTGIVVNSWTTRDGGNQYLIKENGNFDSTDAIAALDEYFHPSYTITYVVKDESSATLFTSEPVGTTAGATITELPTAFQRPLFYTYSTEGKTISESGNTDVEFTATLKEDAPFTPSTSFDEAVWYGLTLKADANIVTYNASGAQNVQLPTSDAGNETTAWAFLGNPYQGFKIVNKAAGANLVLGSAATTGSGNTGGNVYATLQTEGSQLNESWKVISSSYRTNGFFLENTEGHKLNRRYEEANISYWTGGFDLGSTFVASKLPETAITYITDLSQLSNDKVYTIHNTPRAMWQFTETALAADPLSGINLYAEIDNPADKHQIALVKQNDKFYLYSVQHGKYLASNNKLYKSPIEAVDIILSSATNGNYKWFFRFSGYTDKNINTNSVPVIEINNWGSHDFGNTNAILETAATYSVDDAIAAFSDYTQCITDYIDLKSIDLNFTEQIGKLGYPKDGTEATTAFTGILDRNASGSNTAEDWNTFMEKLNAILADANLKLPENGQFLRIKSVLGDKAYLQAADAGSTMKFSTATDNSTIFCFLDNNLVAYQNGLAVNEIKNMGTVGGDATTFTFKKGLNGTMGTCSLYGGENQVLYSTGTDGSDADWFNTSNFKDNTTFTLEEVNELTITLKAVGDKYYATFSAPVDIASITGATVNDVEVSSDNKTVTPKEMDATKGLKANNGVLLIGETNEVVATIGVADESATTTMKSQIASEPAAGHNSAGHYFLGTKSGQIGFYMLKSDGGKTGGFKAYIEKNTSGEAKEGFDLVFGNVTGVETIENGTVQNGEMYNLQGQRVNKAQKGVFIQNGKKVVLK